MLSAAAALELPSPCAAANSGFSNESLSTELGFQGMALLGRLAADCDEVNILCAYRRFRLHRSWCLCLHIQLDASG